MTAFSLEAYHALYEKAGLADISCRSKIIVSGKDRVTVLHRILTQDIRSLAPGDGRPSALLTARGKVLSVMTVLAFENHLLLDMDENLAPAALAALNKLIITEDAVLEIDRAFAHLLLRGPEASKISTGLGFKTPAPPGSAFHHVPFLWQDKAGILIERMDGAFEFLIPAEALSAFQSFLLEKGKTNGVQSVSSETWEVFRIEQGFLRYGTDITEEVTLPETGLDAVLASSTKGCYPGQEVVARTNTYKGHARKLRALILSGTRPPAPGSKIICAGNDAGWVTSACASPRHQAPLALAYLNKNYFETAKEKEFIIEGETVRANVLSLEELEKSVYRQGS